MQTFCHRYLLLESCCCVQDVQDAMSGVPLLRAGNICIYCPGGPDSDFEYSTQSYTGYEPTSMRAIRAR